MHTHIRTHIHTHVHNPFCAGDAMRFECRGQQSGALRWIKAALDLEPEVLAAAFEMRRKVVFTAGNDKTIKVR